MGVLRSKAQFFQKIELVACLGCFFNKSVMLVGRIAQPKFADSLFPVATALEIAQAHALAHVRLQKLVLVVLAGKIIENVQAFFRLLLGNCLGSELYLFNFDSVLAGEIAQRIGVGQVLVLHDELGGVARLAAAKALKDVFGGRNREGGRFFVVKWA
jgi:hypothetical protein